MPWSAHVEVGESSPHAAGRRRGRRRGLQRGAEAVLKPLRVPRTDGLMRSDCRTGDGMHQSLVCVPQCGAVCAATSRCSKRSKQIWKLLTTTACDSCH